MKFNLTLEQYLSINEVRKYDNVPQPLIDRYAKRFKQINSNKKLIEFASKYLPHIKNPLDINQYVNFKDLELVVDYFNKSEDNIDLSSNKDTIYEKDGIQIFLADTKDKCIRYGKGTKWCISSPSANMFYRYRLSPEYKDYTFYFVYNNNLPNTDNYSKVVVHVYYDESNVIKYKCTNLNNDGDNSYSTYTNLVNDVPFLKDLQAIFKPIPFSEDEKEALNVPDFVKGDDLFKELGSWKKVEYYIHKLNQVTATQILNLPENLQKASFDVYFQYTSPDIKLYNKLSNNVQKYFLHVLKRDYLDIYNTSNFLSELHDEDEWKYDLFETNFTKLKYGTNARDILNSFETEEYLFKSLDKLMSNNVKILNIPYLTYLSNKFVYLLKYATAYPDKLSYHIINIKGFLGEIDYELTVEEKNIIREYVLSLDFIPQSTREYLIDKNIFTKNDTNLFLEKTTKFYDILELLDEYSIEKFDKNKISELIKKLVLDDNQYFKGGIQDMIGEDISKNVYKTNISDNKTYLIILVCYWFYKLNIKPVNNRNGFFYYTYFIKEYKERFQKMFGNDFPDKFTEWLDTFE